MTKPNWLYKPAKMIKPAMLAVFQAELMTLYSRLVTDINFHPNQLVSETDVDRIMHECRYLYKYLKLIGTEKYLHRVGLIIVSQPPTPVHTDWPATGYALNMPVLNCEKTYTAWYKADPLADHEKATMYNSTSWYEVADSPLYNTATAIEIDRISAADPHWINVHVPHAAVCGHNKLRINGTIRFHDGIYEYLQNY